MNERIREYLRNYRALVAAELESRHALGAAGRDALRRLDVCEAAVQTNGAVERTDYSLLRRAAEAGLLPGEEDDEGLREDNDAVRAEIRRMREEG